MDVLFGKVFLFIFNLKFGDKVIILGFYGEFFIKDIEVEMVYIGGGVGMVLLCSYIFELFKNFRFNCKVMYWYGGWLLRELFYIEYFCVIEEEFLNFKFNIVFLELFFEDNWIGY